MPLAPRNVGLSLGGGPDAIQIGTMGAARGRGRLLRRRDSVWNDTAFAIVLFAAPAMTALFVGLSFALAGGAWPLALLAGLASAFLAAAGLTILRAAGGEILARTKPRLRWPGPIDHQRFGRMRTFSRRDGRYVWTAEPADYVSRATGEVFDALEVRASGDKTGPSAAQTAFFERLLDHWAEARERVFPALRMEAEDWFSLGPEDVWRAFTLVAVELPEHGQWDAEWGLVFASPLAAGGPLWTAVISCEDVMIACE